MKRNPFLFGMISALLVIFMSGCDNLTIPGLTGQVDKSILITRIGEAEAAKTGVSIGERDQFAPDMEYVLQADLNTLNAAIAEAEAVRSSSSATQVDVNEAAATLNNAVQAFKARVKKDGTKSAGFTQEQLTELIGAAEATKQNVGISADGADISSGALWVTQADMIALNTAINIAKTATADTDDATRDDLYAALGTAIAAFNAARKSGSSSAAPPAPTDKSALITRIGEAAAAKTGVSIGTPDQFAPGMEYVLQADVDTLNAAIVAAETVRDGSSATQAEVNDAAAALNNAVQAFKAKVKTDGTKSAGFTQEQLTALISAAEAAKQGVATSSDGTDVGPGVLWVTPEAMTVFNAAIDHAKTAADTTRDALYAALGTAIASFNAAKQPGTRAKTLTITGLPAAANGSMIGVSLFQTKPTGEEEDLETPVVGGGTAQNGSVTVTLYNDDESLWTGTGNWYVGFMVGNVAYITKTTKSFSGNTVTVAVAECDEQEIGEDSGDGAHGVLTVTGLSGEFVVYVVTTTITNSNLSTIMDSDPVATGQADGSPADLEWFSGNGRGTYNVIIASRSGGGSIRFQNGVTFANGSGSVNWNTMTVADFSSLSAGTLYFTGSPGEGWMVFIVPGPITNGWDGLDAMDDYVAVAPGSPSSNGGWLIFTVGATGGTFNPNGTYAIIYAEEESETLKYQNDVRFSNGNATIDLSSLSDFDFDNGEGGDDVWPTEPPDDPWNPGGGGKTLTITGLSAYDGADIYVGLFKTMPDMNDPDDGDTPVFGMGSVQGGVATVFLLDNATNDLWTENGNWYVGFMIETGKNTGMAYITRTTKSFSGDSVSVTLSECGPGTEIEISGGDSGGEYYPDYPNGEGSGGNDYPDYPPSEGDDFWDYPDPDYPPGDTGGGVITPVPVQNIFRFAR
ncbi:MAG: hypothetical protein LBK63_10835 [Treponema sp.]|nr:hypothetical protein [Treponema sp.]